MDECLSKITFVNDYYECNDTNNKYTREDINKFYADADEIYEEYKRLKNKLKDMNGTFDSSLEKYVSTNNIYGIERIFKCYNVCHALLSDDAIESCFYLSILNNNLDIVEMFLQLFCEDEILMSRIIKKSAVQIMMGLKCREMLRIVVANEKIKKILNLNGILNVNLNVNSNKKLIENSENS